MSCRQPIWKGGLRWEKLSSELHYRADIWTRASLAQMQHCVHWSTLSLKCIYWCFCTPLRQHLYSIPSVKIQACVRHQRAYRSLDVIDIFCNVWCFLLSTALCISYSETRLRVELRMWWQLPWVATLQIFTSFPINNVISKVNSQMKEKQMLDNETEHQHHPYNIGVREGKITNRCGVGNKTTS